MDEPAMDSLSVDQLKVLLAEDSQKYQCLQLQKQMCQSLLGPLAQRPNPKDAGEKVAEAKHRLHEQLKRFVMKTELQRESEAYALEMTSCSDAEEKDKEVVEIERKIEEYNNKLVHYKNKYPTGQFISRSKLHEVENQNIIEAEALLVRKQDLINQSKDITSVATKLKAEQKLPDNNVVTNDKPLITSPHCGDSLESSGAQTPPIAHEDTHSYSVIKKSEWRFADKALSLEFNYPEPEEEYTCFPRLKLTLYFQNADLVGSANLLDHVEANRDALYMTQTVKALLKTATDANHTCTTLYGIWIRHLRLRKDLDSVSERFVIDFKPKTGKLSVVIGSKSGVASASLDVICTILIDTNSYPRGRGSAPLLVKITYGDNDIDHEGLPSMGDHANLHEWLDDIRDLILKRIKH